ncbi:unnamed protein product [Adineta ricciae]|uniref:DUF1279 domain-containing protein n=1 Tax=Adineta ricciae TaxID=249248 RepID=A0A813Y851_ADIRI|nr:unnamed protein product [Adineta ricciae]
MWHLCRCSSRPLIGVGQLLIRQSSLIPIKPIVPQRTFSFPSVFKLKKNLPEPISQPSVNPRHPPDYVPPRPHIDPHANKPVQSQSSIFARFRHAYSKYGRILLVVHFFSSCAWFTGLVVLHFKGFDLGMYLIDGLTRINIISPERRLSFIRRMNEFSVAGILSRIPFISQERLDSLNAYWPGERVRLLATALLLYKFLAPIRYAFTLGATTYISRTFLKRGLLKRAPQGDSLQELYRDQKQLIKSHVRRARDKMKTTARRGGQKPE